MIDEKKTIQDLHNAGGCDAQDEWSKGWDEAITEAIKIVERQPKVDKWIPCSEGLPEGWVQVQVREKHTGHLWLPQVGEFLNGKWWLKWQLYPLNDRLLEVIAWQPLPEPYKEGGQEDGIL